MSLPATPARTSWWVCSTADALYEGGETTALQAADFVSNHDVGRYAHYVRKAFPQADDEEVLKRVIAGARDDVHAARRTGRLFGR